MKYKFVRQGQRCNHLFHVSESCNNLMYNFQIILMSFTVVPIRLVLVLLLLVMALALATVSDLSRYIIFSIITDRVDVVHRRAYPSGACIAPVGDGVGPGYRVARLPISVIIFSIITDRVDVVHRRAYPSGAGITSVGGGVGPGYRVRS